MRLNNALGTTKFVSVYCNRAPIFRDRDARCLATRPLPHTVHTVVYGGSL